jgi:hypothetical protein
MDQKEIKFKENIFLFAKPQPLHSAAFRNVRQGVGGGQFSKFVRAKIYTPESHDHDF